MSPDGAPSMEECLAGAKAALEDGYRIVMTYPLDEAARLATRPGEDQFEGVRERIAGRREACRGSRAA